MKVGFIKKIISISVFVFGFLCVVNAQEPPKDSEPKHSGKVSHQYKKAGCSSVIIIKRTPPEEDLVLIPKTPLPKKLDKEGMELKFNYRVLRMPNPKGCEKGQPAELSDIQKK